MSIVYLNGEFVKSEEAKISIFDTGFYYGDGIYEVALLFDGRIVDLESHLERLNFTLTQVKFNNVPSIAKIKEILYDLVLKNKNIKNGLIYLQITRGIMENRYSKLQDIKTPTIIAYIVETSLDYSILKPLKCALLEDPRRYRRDIKMISLMPMILSKLEANENGYEYVIFKDRISKAITEGMSSNLFIVKKDETILTHPINNKILSGCTRKKTIEFLKQAGHKVEEKEFFEEDLLNAKEAFVTGAIKLYVPIESINGHQIGEGANIITKFCMEKYIEFITTFPKVL